MEDGLRTVMKEYIDQVNDVCLRLLAGLCLKSKADFLCSRKLRWGIEHETNGTKYLLHGAGCRACDGERYLDWNFGYGSRWCGIDPWLLARTLEYNRDPHTEYYDGNRVKAECEQAVSLGEMYQKHNLYYFTIPVSETFEPQFPKEFDTLIVEHFEDRWVIPRNRMVERFLRKSRRVYKEIGSSLNKYTLRFMLDGKETGTFLYDNVCYPERAVTIMREILINLGSGTDKPQRMENR